MKALIFGVAGQDGSYLSELLLEKGYDVHGVKRRASSFNTSRIDHLIPNKNYHLHYGDITDSLNVMSLVKEIEPDEIYNLAAQSHVKVSFEIPEYTSNVDAVGTLRILEAIKQNGLIDKTKYYQASTSELFGLVQEIPQKETTPFYPRSPYGVSKLYSYWMVRNYREAYNIFASNGILFNHECFFPQTPIILKKNGEIYIDYISNLTPSRLNIDKDISVLSVDYDNSGIEIWDGNNFVKLKTLTRRKLSSLEKCNQIKQITNARLGSVQTTPNHNMFDFEENKIPASELTVGSKILSGEMPNNNSTKKITREFSFVLGMLCGDGYVSEDGKICLINNSEETRNIFIEKIKNILVEVNIKISESISGFNGKTTRTNISGIDSNFGKFIRNIIYDKKSKHKKVPNIILNCEKEIQLEFIKGYYLCDGLKSKVTRCSYDFQSFKSNSPILAQGLLYLISNTTNQRWCINTYENDSKNTIYSINLNSDKLNNKGKHKQKIQEEVSKIYLKEEYKTFVYDIETESGKVMAGVGKMIVSNSPRRGETFVTNKIVLGLNDIMLGKSDCLYLGNLNSKRDWGHAKDFVNGMYLILQHDKPDDFVIATGKQYSVREFVEQCAPYFGMRIYWEGDGLDEVGIDSNSDKVVVRVDSKYFRPTEVETLLGDSTKARTVLNWEPKYDFIQLVEEMCQYVIERNVYD